MKKFLIVFFCFTFVVSTVLAQDIFLTLTKYDESIEKLPTNITIITQKEIVEKHVETLGELLQNEVGINFRSHGTIGSLKTISIRGAASAQTLVLLDGRRINDIGLGSVNFNNIPVVNIERVEVIKGAGAAVYGTGAFGGIVNVITKKANMDSPIIEADISYGSFNTFSPSIISAYSNNKYSILATLSNISRDGDRTNSKFVNTNVFFSGQINASENSKISLTGNIYNAKYGLPGSLLIPTLRDKQQDNNKYLKLDYDFSFDKNKSVSINGYCSRDIMRNQSYLYSTDDRYTSDTYGFQTDFHYADVLLLGAEYWKECFQDDSRKNCAVYSQLNYDIWKFRLIPSLRVDNNSVFGWVFTPALSAIFNLNDKVKFSANSGKVWRAPTFNDLYYPGLGNPDLKPEYGLSSDIGAEYSYGKIKLIATGFYINSKDLIRWDGTRSKNIAKTKQYGFEFEAGYIMNLLLSHKLNYTYLKAEDESTKKILEYTPENTINYILNIKFTRNFTISAVVCYRSDLIGTRYYPDNSISVETIDGFFTLDMNINYKLNENIDFWIKGFNLTNTNYQMFCDYPMPKLTVYAGINARVLR